MLRAGRATIVLLAIAWSVADASGQTLLTLDEAMARARSATPEARALAAASGEASERVKQARAGYFPRIDVAEDVQRGNPPVFVFGSLLSQRRFIAANFAIDALNHPSPITNVRTRVDIVQPLFDAGLTRLAVQGAEITRDLVAAAGAGATQDLALGAAKAFIRVLQLESAIGASRAAVEAAEGDLERARARRDVGLVTDADVLAVDVHLADMRQRQISTTADLAVARIQLCASVGAPLDAALTLVRPARLSSPLSDEALIREAIASRPERREADLRAALASNAHRTARATLLPRLGVQGGWELNGPDWGDAQSSWIVGAEVRFNVFRGFGDVARMAEAKQSEVRAAADRERVARAIEVDVRAAIARVAAARAREATGQAALAQARESQRIVRDRYDGGLATIADVLRAAEAVLDAESRAAAAGMDVILQTVALDRAVGRL